MVDTNSDPRQVDFIIPSNDDASKSIDKVLSIVTSAIADGLAERKSERAEKDNQAKKAEVAPKVAKVEPVAAAPVKEEE